MDRTKTKNDVSANCVEEKMKKKKCKKGKPWRGSGSSKKQKEKSIATGENDVS